MADAKEDFNKESINSMELFLAAARVGDKEEIKNLMESGLDVNAPDGTGHGAIHMACALGLLEAVEALLDCGADKNRACFLGLSPLSYAMTNGQNAIAKMLLERGADPDQLIDTDTAPLTLAASSGNEEQVRLLLKYKASQVPPEPSKDAAGITVAAGAGHLNIVRIMHEEFGVDLNISSGPNGLTPLCAAIKSHKETCFDYLLKKGADINVSCGVQKLRSLEVAVGADNPWATEELLRRGMAVNAPGTQGVTTLMLAAMVGAAKSAQVLLKHGANIEATLENDNTARRIAEVNGCPAIVALIDAEQRSRHLKAVDLDAAHAHGGLSIPMKVSRPLSFRKSQPL
jgi:ankyrin repeat protein